MSQLGFLVTLEAHPDKVAEVVEFLVQAKSLVDAEPGTRTWHAFRVGPTSFRIFDTFDTEADRQVHLHGKVRDGLDTHGELFSTPPTITEVDVLAVKLPGS
ncbi:MAG: antibiotic biosynthesis monooxygenase [Mycobacterium sp.]